MIDELAKEIAEEAEEESLAEIARLTARVAELKDALNAFEIYGCPVCHGDCSAANPPVSLCPMRMAHESKVFHQPK